MKNIFIYLFNIFVFTFLITERDTFEIKLIQSLDELSLPISVARSIDGHISSALKSLFHEESLKFDSDANAKKMLSEPFKGTLSTFSTGNNDQITEINKFSKIALSASRSIMSNKSYGYSGSLEKYTAPSKFCPYASQPYCNFNSPYRTADGSCNNKNNPWWGKSISPFKRLLAPVYDDGLEKPRSRSMNGERLPNPREIALRLDQPNPKREHGHVTTLFTHFSQFIDHDITLTSMTSDQDGNPIKCFCDREDLDCINIEIPLKDKHNTDERCMVTPRSTPSYRKFNCNLGAREQLNILTHWLDLSQTYGNNAEKSFKLRLYSYGLLNTSVVQGMKRHYMPFSLDGTCLNIPEKKPCFMSGDTRTNQNGMLTSLQTVWLREHNKVASKLLELNPYWNDEQLFQEARRLVTAKYQHIIYSEWLPLLIGRKAAILYELIPLNQNYFYGYNSKLYPAAINEFSTAAFRFGHTMVADSFPRTDPDYRIFQNLSVIETVFKPEFAFTQGGIDSLMRGSIIKMSDAFDPNVNNMLVNHLFEGLNKDTPTIRFSLPALNINRGRDHGLPGYNHYRSLCGLNYAYSFDDLYNIPENMRKELAEVYNHVNDIDLYTGGVNEHPIEGGVVGPTFACIIAKQFRDLKFGDRFYYENGNENLIKFTTSQLDEIRKSNMARVLCDNVEITYIQKNPFLKADLQLNPLINCDLVDDIDYNLWKSIYTY